MKMYFIGLSLSAVFLVTGCGGGSDSGESINLDAEVIYKTTAQYDIREYMVPLENSLNVYSDKTYINESGKKSFSGDPEEDTYTEKYDVNLTGVVVRDGDDLVDSVYVVKSDRITYAESGNSDSPDEIARFADIGDYVLSFTSSETENGNIPVTSKVACKLVDHYESKEIGDRTYNDVLKIECKQSSDGSLKNQNIDFVYSSEADSEIYFAKNIGEIYSEDITCQNVNTILNGQETENSTCEKSVIQIISHNKL